jgi:hypothetical protein
MDILSPRESRFAGMKQCARLQSKFDLLSAYGNRRHAARRWSTANPP